ncbi:hypothetical protein RB195_012401 [Necator americanus]|uniref:Uncharacterized protein n=1 Tax=Necator americanus TaxID=51031 RepID=A0ABR1D8R2_NECAM
MRDEIAVERHLRHGGEVFLGTHDRLKIGGLGFLINPGVAVDVDHLLTLVRDPLLMKDVDRSPYSNPSPLSSRHQATKKKTHISHM